MASAQKLSIPFEGKVGIPGYPRHLIDIWGNVFIHVTAFNDREYLRNANIYKDFYGLMYCYLGNTKKRRDRHYITDLLELSYPTGNLSLIKSGRSHNEEVKTINRPTGESRVKLNRERVINFLLTFYKDQVQIPLTRNRNGVYEASEDMKELGIAVCPECGHCQPVEQTNCIECNEWILKA